MSMRSTPRPTGSVLTKLQGWIAVAVATPALLLGCSISPQPEPPADLTPSIAASEIEISATASGLRVSGAPGAVEGTAAELRIYNLETANVRVDATVADDGSFTADLDGMGGDRLRLQVRSDDGVSAPMDLTGVGVAQPVTTPLADCLIFSPPSEIDFGDTSLNDFQVGRVDMRNDCATDVSLYSIGVLVAESAFSFIIPTDPVIPAGSSRPFGVAFTPSRTGEHEDVVILSLEDGAEDRPITIRGRGTR